MSGAWIVANRNLNARMISGANGFEESNNGVGNLGQRQVTVSEKQAWAKENTEARQALLNAVFDRFQETGRYGNGITFFNLPASVQKAFKVSFFKDDMRMDADGKTVGSTRPLTQRRIKRVMEAVEKALAPIRRKEALKCSMDALTNHLGRVKECVDMVNRNKGIIRGLNFYDDEEDDVSEKSLSYDDGKFNNEIDNLKKILAKPHFVKEDCERINDFIKDLGDFVGNIRMYGGEKGEGFKVNGTEHSISIESQEDDVNADIWPDLINEIDSAVRELSWIREKVQEHIKA